MNLQTLIDEVNKATPAINAMVAAFDPAVAGAVAAAEAVINAGVAMAQKKAMYTAEAWAANAATVNAGADDILAAEREVLGTT